MQEANMNKHDREMWSGMLNCDGNGFNSSQTILQWTYSVRDTAWTEELKPVWCRCVWSSLWWSAGRHDIGWAETPMVLCSRLTLQTHFRLADPSPSVWHVSSDVPVIFLRISPPWCFPWSLMCALTLSSLPESVVHVSMATFKIPHSLHCEHFTCALTTLK